jgi:hypothetical protein
MELKDAMLKLKEKVDLFFGTETPTVETVEVKFKDMKLQDGTTIISIDGDDLAIGVPVYVMTDEGRLPAPDGELVLEDGTMLTVVDGLVAEVSTPEEEAPEGEVAAEPATVPTTETPAQADMSTKPKRVIKSQVEEHVFNAFKEDSENKLAELKAEFEALKEKFAKSLEFNKEVFSIVEQIAEQPSTTATEAKAKPFDVKLSRQIFKEDLKQYYK